MNRHLLVRLTAGGVLALFCTIAPAAQSNERVLYVNAFDEATRAPVTGLSARDIVVREDGMAREVLRVTPATSPMAMAVLVDNSYAARNHIADVRKALSTFMHGVDGLGPVALVGFADRPTILQDYTTNQKLLEGGVGKVFAMPGSGATLLDAIVEVSKGLQKREEDRAAMVILTIENVEFSTRYYKDVLEELAKGGAQMHIVVLNTPAGARLDDPSRNRASVFDLGPKNSGGTRMDVLTSISFDEKLKELAGILKSQHRVVYSRPQTLIPPERVEVSSAKPGVTASGGPARGQAVR
jgi:hypothetical protein